jgi:tetrapyrrole methylase family protein / MazG family protein
VSPPRPHITVVGLGPAGPDLVGDATARLLAAACAAGRGYVRTARHPAAARFGGARTFDDRYQSAGSFEEVYTGIVDALISAATSAAPEPVVYAVPGSPLVAERTVELLRAEPRADVTIVPALSFLDLAWAALGVDPLTEGVRLVDAEAFGVASREGGGPLLVAQCWSRRLLSEVKLGLGDGEGDRDGDEDADGDDAPRAVLLHHLGLDDQVVAEVEWWELDRTLEPDHLTSLWVPARRARRTGPGEPAEPTVAAGREVGRLAALMDTLRERCPWDRAQTHATLMPHLVEECYEVLDALAALTADAGAHATVAAGSGSRPAGRLDRFDDLEEELGDLLFQIVFHARLACEEGAFDLAGVARRVHDKLVHRHPHVFGDLDAPDADHVATTWEEIKRSEKGRRSVTEGIPARLPALLLTTKLARKARAVGLQPDDVTDAGAASTVQALATLAARADTGADQPLAEDAAELERAVGELLYFVANVAQRVGVDAEQALRTRALVLRAAIRDAEGVPDQG